MRNSGTFDFDIEDSFKIQEKSFETSSDTSSVEESDQSKKEPPKQQSNAALNI
jgi:hypothetical protein